MAEISVKTGEEWRDENTMLDIYGFLKIIASLNKRYIWIT